jgi:hypothetical protein
MPLDVLGRTRATLTGSSSLQPWLIGLGNLLKASRAGDRSLQFLIFNEEFLVNASHQLALITSLPFVHTARRYYRLNGLVSSLDCCALLATSARIREGDQTWSFRGSKSRNKVSVGEPAEGSLTRIHVQPPVHYDLTLTRSFWWQRVILHRMTQSLWRGCVLMTCSFFCLFMSTHKPISQCYLCSSWAEIYEISEQLLAMDILVLVTMKNAAKCDT